jgi:hypothetical protein
MLDNSLIYFLLLGTLKMFYKNNDDNVNELANLNIIRGFKYDKSLTIFDYNSVYNKLIL